jgi:D-alanyl-lipoteichoic acid acyltransferase DltB (MBOAT superfamily)
MLYPQLVAGPIERPQTLLPQFRRPHYFRGPGAPYGGFRDFDEASLAAGLQLMALGLFKKIVIADRLAVVVNVVYDAPHLFAGPAFIVATVLFAVQIYCDFSGYSDIARGTARVMGFRLSRNFDRPYAATSIADFWRRWHISLSTWFRDYVYLPLGGSRVSPPRWIANVMLTFLISGLWHGANWTFVLWGALNGAYFVIGRLTASARERVAERLGWTRVPALRTAVSIVTTFALACSTWIFFRARSIGDGWYIATHMLDLHTVGQGGGLMTRLGIANLPLAKHEWLVTACLLTGTALSQVLNWRGRITDRLPVWPAWTRWTMYYGAAAAILFLGVYKKSAFIYFQF